MTASGARHHDHHRAKALERRAAMKLGIIRQ
jgi:hypothetical protein